MVFNAQHKPIADLFGLPDPPTTGSCRLVHAAIELFYSHGFQAVGVDQIISAAGVTKTTFYKHFQSKTELMVAAIEMRDDWEMSAWVNGAKKLGGDDPRAQLLALFDILDIWFNDADFGGCMFLNAASEFPNPNDPVHKAAAAHKVSNWNLVRDLAIEAGAEDAEGFSDLFMMLFEGALVLRQVYGRSDAARSARPAIERLIDESL
jgi:AcrR family transcriptional regulator